MVGIVGMVRSGSLDGRGGWGASDGQDPRDGVGCQGGWICRDGGRLG